VATNASRGKPRLIVAGIVAGIWRDERERHRKERKEDGKRKEKKRKKMQIMGEIDVCILG